MDTLLVSLPYAAVILLLLGILVRVCSDARPDGRIESELENAERRVGEAADRASHVSKAAGECAEALGDSERGQQEAERKVGSVKGLVARARERNKSVKRLAEECEKILSEAKKEE